MAILFDDAATEYLERDAAPVTAVPLTMACWFNVDEDAKTFELMWIGDKDAAPNNEEFGLRANPAAAGDPVQASIRSAGTSVAAATTTGLTVGQWHHACGVQSATNARAAYIDGGSKGTNTSNLTPAGLDRIAIGRSGRPTPANYTSGNVAEAAVWNVALTDAEIALLGKGFSPLFFRPEKLVFYSPLIRLAAGGVQRDWIGGFDLTEFNTPASAAHPPKIIYPSWVMAEA